MTRVAPKQAMEVTVPREARPSVVLTWSISRAGAVACGLAENQTGPAVRLEIVIPPPGGAPAQLTARVLDGDRAIPLEGPHGTSQWIEDTIRGVWHLDVDGVLKLTVRQQAGGQQAGTIEALYARTELLSRAGVAGGRYEFEGASTRP
jgi:hypothetical protein